MPVVAELLAAELSMLPLRNIHKALLASAAA